MVVDYDVEDEMVYFLDIRNFVIMKVKVDGFFRKVFRYKLWKFILKFLIDIYVYVLVFLFVFCIFNFDIYVGNEIFFKLFWFVGL